MTSPIGSTSQQSRYLSPPQSPSPRDRAAAAARSILSTPSGSPRSTDSGYEADTDLTPPSSYSSSSSFEDGDLLIFDLELNESTKWADGSMETTSSTSPSTSSTSSSFVVACGSRSPTPLTSIREMPAPLLSSPPPNRGPYRVRPSTPGGHPPAYKGSTYIPPVRNSLFGPIGPARMEPDFYRKIERILLKHLANVATQDNGSTGHEELFILEDVC